MKNHLIWETLAQKYIIRDQWINLRADTCRMPDGSIVEPYYTLEYPFWVNVTAITEEEEIVMIWQYRHAYGEVMLEHFREVPKDYLGSNWMQQRKLRWFCCPWKRFWRC